MKFNFIKYILLFYAVAFLQITAQAADRTATVKINRDVVFQKITGFGGFVCSPQFSYNHMTDDEIRKLWGKDSEAGYNIIRLYLDISSASPTPNWSATISPRALQIAKLAQELGLIIFASPWSMPAAWKTNGTTNTKDSEGNLGHLKTENYEDYANYLNSYVTYMRDNGVNLYAISLQNEPDMEAEYAGCIWTPQEMADFIKNYAHRIDCRIIAAEGVGITDNYANAFLPDDISSKLGIFAGHQYNGSIGGAHKLLQAKGLETWMTEYLTQWTGSENRDFNWSIDAFTFTDRIHNAMVNNVNAWVHYAAKRFYGMIGDNERGTVAGQITKRGHILSQYAKYTIGATRIEDVWSDPALKGTSYLSVTGDSVIVALSNSTDNSYTLTVDLPFNTTTGSKITTSATFDNDLLSVNPASETYRPKVTIDPSSFTTLIFTKSSERPPVQMTNTIVHFNKIEDQQVINPTQFGADYQLSGKTGIVFNHSQQKYLISANTDDNNGYLLLNDRYNKLVFRINSLAGGTSGNTTLYYTNSKGEVKSLNYGNISISGSNFDWILDISRDKLTDGCTGIIGIRNSNYGTVLNFNFGDVYFLLNNEKMHKFTGTYDGNDEDLSSCLEDPAYVSLDFSDVADLSGSEDWRATAANKNCIFYIDGGVSNTHANIVAGNVCHQLALTDEGGYFYAPNGFTATGASYTCTLDGYKTLVLPFEAGIPSGLTAYTLEYVEGRIVCTQISSGNKIPANTPVLIAGTGTFTLDGGGAVSTPKVEVNGLRGVYITTQAPVGSYYLKTVDGVTGFHKVTESENIEIMPFNAYLIQEEESAASLPLFTGIDDLPQVNALNAWTREGRLHVSGLTAGKSWSVYNLSGKLVYQAIADSDKADVALAFRGVYVVASESQRVKVIN